MILLISEESCNYLLFEYLSNFTSGCIYVVSYTIYRILRDRGYVVDMVYIKRNHVYMNDGTICDDLPIYADTLECINADNDCDLEYFGATHDIYSLDEMEL